MKKTLLTLLGFFGLFSATMQAQTFTTPADTVWGTANPYGTIHQPVKNITTSTLSLRWKVIATDFPSDWLAGTAFGICDNNLCYNNSAGGSSPMQLWNEATSTGNTFVCNYYANSTSDSMGILDVQMSLASATSIGTHWVTVRIDDPASSSTKTVTYVINRAPVSVPKYTNANTDISIYPNPAVNELNVVYSATADVKNISVYNIIGKVMNVYKVSATSANLNIENLPSGIYFVRLSNSRGEVVITKKFTKS